MPRQQKRSRVVNFESRLRERATEKYVLRLYIAGTTPRSSRAVANIRNICERNLNGRYDLEVIDIYQKPACARRADYRRADSGQASAAAVAPVYRRSF